MNVLLIGGGGREHALAWKLAKSPLLGRLYAAPGSDAIGLLAQRCLALDSAGEALQFCRAAQVELVVIGPEGPLAAGWADVLRQGGVAVFGPGRAAARLEASKEFAKQAMLRWGVPTAAGRSFTRFADARAQLRTMRPPYVLKADGLAAGKGVSIHQELEEAEVRLQALLEGGALGAAGQKVLLEAYLEGEEASFFAFCAGTEFLVCPVSQDHKRLLDGDRGPNTGGMGAYAPAAVVDTQVAEKVVARILRPTLQGLAAAGTPYTGLLYIGLMLSGGEPQVVEFNCRFGDPECQPLMLLLESDLLPLLHGVATGALPAPERVAWRGGAAACVVLAAREYPTAASQPQPIQGLEARGRLLQPHPAAAIQLEVFHAATRREAPAGGSAAAGQGRAAGGAPGGTATSGDWHTAGGRVLGLCAHAADLPTAVQAAYAAVAQIRWPGMQYRTDIAERAR